MFVQNKRRRHLGAMSVISDKMLGESEQNLGKETQSLQRLDNFLASQWKGPLVLEAITFFPLALRLLLLLLPAPIQTTMSLRIGSQRLSAVLRAQRTSASQTLRRSYASTATSNLPEAKKQEIQVGNGKR